MTNTEVTGSPRAARRVLLAKPRGYCAGVDRAVQAVEMALDRFGPPVYVRRQIVHNTHVVATLEKRGAIFVTEVDERWLDSVTTVGVTSGASVPEELVTSVLAKLASCGFGTVEEVEAVDETMTFALPRELRASAAVRSPGAAG